MRKIIVGAWGLFFRAGKKAPLMLTGDQDPPERRHRRDLSTRGNLIARTEEQPPGAHDDFPHDLPPSVTAGFTLSAVPPRRQSGAGQPPG